MRDSPEPARIDSADDVVAEFLSETREGLDQFDRDVLGLFTTSSPADDLARIFRIVHTIKGASSFLAFSQIEMLAHAAEGLLGRLREGRLLPGPANTAPLLEAADAIRSLLVTIETTGQEQTGDWHNLIRQLRDAATATNSATLGTAHPLTLDEAAKPIGQLLVERAGVEPAAVAAARELQRRGDLRTLGEILVSQGLVSPPLARSVVEYQQEARTASAIDTCVRVDVARLDKLVHLAGALSTIRDRIVQLSQRVEWPQLSSAAQDLDNIAGQLRRETRQASRQPIGALWGRLPRLVRDLALAGGKQVHLRMEGREIELDRLILEAIQGPILHLIRNAVDHGIETPKERRASGKPPHGCLTVRALIQAENVQIEVIDDGGGINLDQVKHKAVVTGLLAQAEASRLNEQQVANLIFLPGLTTADRVSNISGRGVGMDVVKTNLEKVGGSVAVWTQRGKGTTVTLWIPFRHDLE
jgi:two-component system, chemotaxis family, sensor kinase CheA